MANYDEVVKRNKDYLTQAQINALAAASKEYNIANAGNRAGALASAREQYDTAYRGLQNMGLAGNPNAAPASGEVPRLQMQVKTPFESYNERLKQVENQRLGALGEQFKQDTIAQRQAEEAARAAQAEAMRRAQLQAAAQTLQSTAFKVGTTVMQGFANKVMGISSTKKENPAVANATKAQIDGVKRTQQVQQQTVNAAVKAQIDGMNRTARPQDVAAAAAFNIAHYSQQPAVTAANAAQERGMKLTEQYKGAADTSKANQYYVDANQKAFTKEQAEVEYKEAQNNLTNLQQKRHGGGAVSEDEYKAAVYQRDAAKLKAENPKLYQSFAIIENPYADAKSREEAGNEIMRAYGYTNDERTAEQYTADKKKAAQYSSYLATFDDKNASAEEKKAAENMLKNMGVTPDQAREFISKHRQARAGQGEYAYYKNAIINSLTYAGKTPSRGVNKDETDPLYRAVNKLPDITEEGNNYLMEGLPRADVTTSEEYVGNELRYLSKDERNAYNYIYETEGLQKANQYIRDGLPLRNVRAAIDDEAYAKQLVENYPVAANFLSIAAGTVGNVPAMIEKLVKGTYNFVAQPQTPLFIDTNDDRLANMSNLIQSATSQKILESNPGTSGKIYNFAYQTGMSMAQSAVAMTFAAAGAPWAVDVMFFSSAGNEAYKDAIERGATQEQALAYGVLSGTAEALFEHASIEHFMNLDYQGKGRVIRNMLSQAGAEASEEVNTELADILADAWTMRDKSQYNQAVQKYMSNGETEEQAQNHAFLDQLKNVGMAGLGGLVSGLGFGVFGALPNAVSQVKTGKEAKASKVVDQYVRNAALLGGDAQRLAQEVNDAYGVKKTKSGSIETEKVAGREKMKTTEPSNRLVGALVQQVNKQVQELAQSAESGAAVQTLLTGEKLTTNGAKAVMDQLGADTVKEMGYDTSSPSAFAKSFNARLQENSITPRMQEVGKYRQAAYGMAERRNSPIEYQEKYRAFTAEDRANAAVTAARANATNRVWANPTQGMAMATPDGTKVTPMPGNMRAVEQAEQERTNFKARSTATKGNVTYAVAGMQAREGLSNEQTYSEIQKGLTKEARQKAQLYEKLASALGVKMVIHDVMTGTNGFIDEKGNMHVVLSGKQSVLRVAAHELTHLMKENAGNEYASMRDHLISEVGQEKFDRMTKQKANEYGIDLSTEKGKILADDEVCAELCERMLSNEDALEKFAEKDTAAAKTLKEHLLKILNAIKAAFKRAENRDFGESWSDLIKSQDTIESWITGLQKAIDNSGKKTAEKTDAMRGDLFLSEEDEARAERKKQAEVNAEKGTYVRGISAKEMDSVLSNVMVGDKSNYEGDDYEHSRAMIAQLVPEVIDALNGEANLDDVQAKLETAVGEMVDNYFEEYGDGLPNLRSKIDATIGISDQAKGEIKYSEKNMRKVANEISHALGKRVTLVGETNPKFKTAQKLDSLWEAMNEDEVIDQKYNWSTDVNKLVDFINDQSADRVKLTGKERENTIYAKVGEMISAVSDMLSEKTGKRYSLDVPHEGIEMKKPVEGTDKLIAIHNLTGDELARSLKRGGFPMPSIAVLKQSQGHSRYGDVSVIFGRETIDPQASRSNKVYGGDAWTPTYPTIEYKPNANVEEKIRKKYYELSRKIGYDKTRPMYNYVTDMERQLNNNQGEAAMLQKLYEDTDMMQVFLDDTGKGRVEDIYNEKRTEMSKEDKDFYRGFIDELGENVVLGYSPADNITGTDRIRHRRQYLSDHRQEIVNAYKKILGNQFGFSKSEIDNAAAALDNRQLITYLNAMTHLLKDNGVTVETKFDSDATYKAIMDKVDQKEYREWVDGLFKGIEEKSGIRNKADYWTRSGNRRSFEALHYEDTLENVVKVMREQNQTGNTAIFSGNAIWGVAAKDYKTVSEIKKDSSRLKTMSEDEYKQVKEQLGQRFQSIAQSIADKKADNVFIALDNAMENIVEAVRLRKTKDGILRYLSQYHDGVTMKTVDQIVDLVRDIANMPTEYFEAKPMRAVGADEIKTVILPAGKYSNLEADLAKRGVPVVTYEYGNDADRLRALQSAEVSQYLFSLDTDAIRQAFTVIDTAGIEDGLEALKDVKHVGSFALKDITRFLDASAGKNKDLRNTLHAIFEAPHSEATGRYAQGVERMQRKVLDIGKRAGVCDEKGKHFDSKKSAAIQNIGEGFSNTYTDLKLKVKDADHVTVKAYEPGTDKLVDSEKDYTLKELRQAYGTNAADYVWSRVFDETQKAQETGGKPGWVDEKVNTRPYTIDDLQTAYPNDWQKLKAAADEFRQMYDEYIRDQNNMLATIYPIESEYADVEKLDAGIEKKQERLAQHKAAVETQIENLQKSLEAKEKEIASKKRTDTNAYRQLVEQANKLTAKIAEVKAEIAEYEANAKDELMKMNVLKAEMQNAVQKGDYSLKRMHRLQYRSDYFHHFTEMASGIQNLKSIFTNNTDIAPAIVGKSENTKAKTKWAGYFQQRMGGDYTADALNGMLRYGQLAEYKLAFDPLTAYLRDVNKQIRNMSSDTNRDGLIRYIDQWADNIAGKSHKLDRVVSDSGMAPRKAMQVLQWINSRVIQNTLLFNMRSALVQISNITNAKGIVKNNIDWVNGLKAWALAAKGDEAMASIMAQSNFLASRYMDGLALTDSKLKSAKQFAGWMLGALDEVSAKATWWAAYQQYTRNPNAAKNQYRNYDSAVDYADDITRRTHAGRGVGELAPAMTSRVINFVAPFQVEVNNTWQLLKDNVKQKNYLGLLSTGLSVFLFNAAFEAIVGSTPLGFDFIRAVIDIALGFLNDDPDDDPDAKEIAQRFAGELVGGLPFASQLVAAFGEDNAKKVLGENNDATRYGNTQIGVSAVVNAVKGLKDIGTGLIQGRRVNWLDDLDDLMNLTLPMGAKQLTRTAQGLATVAKGYGGKYDKEGNEKVQFVTDQDVLHYIHAGLFGKWALTEASEYFGEKRLLPELFGAYNGKKSSIGTMVDAKEYKAALDTGIDGKDYFTLKYDLKSYTTQAGKRAEMMQQSFTPEQKAQLDALLFAGKDDVMKTDGALVYKQGSDGEWDLKADYTDRDMFDLSTLGTKIYDTTKGLIRDGFKKDSALTAAHVWDDLKDTPDEIEGVDDRKLAFRNMLMDSTAYTVQEKEQLDKAFCAGKNTADYSDKELYDLSINNRGLYEKAKAAKEKGIPVKQYVSLNEKKNAYTGEDKADYLRREVMNTNLTAKQKEALDDILISDKDRYIDYSTKAWFEISMLGKGQYTEAKEGTKVGLKPETYLTVYKKWKTLDAKDENGNTRNGLKKKRAKEYLDSLSLSGPEYSYIWTAVFGYK